MSSDPELDELKREFLSEAEGKVAEITELLNSEASKDSCERMIYLAHQLKGAGGSYGFPSISSDATALETALEKMQEGSSPELLKEVRTRLQNLTDDVQTRQRELVS